MRIAAVCLFLSVIHSQSSLAAFTDFSDFTQRAEFAVGEEFQSNGISFQVVDLIPQLSTALVHLDLLFPDPLFTDLHVGPGVEFLLPDNTQEVSFFFQNGGGWAISINGVEPFVPAVATPIFLDGMSVAGVAVSVDSMSSPHYCGECGIFTLRGPITSFAIAGVEMSIDDVSVIVPEPSSLLLLLLGLPFLSRWRA